MGLPLVLGDDSSVGAEGPKQLGFIAQGKSRNVKDMARMRLRIWGSGQAAEDAACAPLVFA